MDCTVCIADSKDDTTNLMANISSHCHLTRLLVIGSREKGAEDAGEREEGGSRLQVAVGRSYRLGEGRDPSGLWHVWLWNPPHNGITGFQYLSFLNNHVSEVVLELAATKRNCNQLISMFGLLLIFNWKCLKGTNSGRLPFVPIISLATGLCDGCGCIGY